MIVVDDDHIVTGHGVIVNVDESWNVVVNRMNVGVVVQHRHRTWISGISGSYNPRRVFLT